MKQGNSWQRVLDHRADMYEAISDMNDAINNVETKITSFMDVNKITEITLMDSIETDDFIMIKRNNTSNINIYTNDSKYHILSFMNMILNHIIADKYANLFTEFVNKL